MGSQRATVPAFDGQGDNASPVSFDRSFFTGPHLCPSKRRTNDAASCYVSIIRPSLFLAPHVTRDGSGSILTGSLLSPLSSFLLPPFPASSLGVVLRVKLRRSNAMMRSVVEGLLNWRIRFVREPLLCAYLLTAYAMASTAGHADRASMHTKHQLGGLQTTCWMAIQRWTMQATTHFVLRQRSDIGSFDDS